jgi:beta-lactamase class A
VRSATRFAASSPGLVSFAVIDSAGGLRGHAANRQYVSASAVKALLLAAELGRLERERLPLDPLTEQMLKSMITISDNDAADEIYYRVGDDGLYSVARRAGMANFEVSGYWANAQLTAADMARFFLGLEHNLVGPHRRFAKRLLAGIVSYQRWGVPAAAGKRWRVWFKGGWRATGLGQLAHQAALLRAKDGRRLGLAVLTDGQPSQEMAIEAIAEVTRRLLARDRPSWRWAA